jgi:hypothetical protein
LIVKLLEGLLLPEEIAIAHVSGHHRGTPQRLREPIQLIRLRRRLPLVQNAKCCISPPPSRHLLEPHFHSSFQLERLGASQTPEGKWLLPDGREILSKLLMRDTMTQLHQGSR